MRISDWSSDVCSSDLDRPLRVGAQRQAGNVQVGGLLLNAAGIGDREPGVADQVHELVVAQRLGKADALLALQGGGQSELAQAEIGRASCREGVCQNV